MRPRRRRFLLGLAACAGVLLALAAPVHVRAQAQALSPDEAALVARAESYLNGITTLQASIFQIAPDGAMAEGTLYIERPGRLRLEYAPPVDVLLVGADGWLTYTDGELRQHSQTPIAETPAGVLVRADIRFSGDIEVRDVAREADLVYIRLARTEAPDDGAITLVFTERPFELRQWVVVDPQGLTTRITLFELRRGHALDPALFAAPPPFPEDDGMR